MTANKTSEIRCKTKGVPLIVLCASMVSVAFSGQAWIIDTQRDWQAFADEQSNLEYKEGMAVPTEENATFRSKENYTTNVAEYEIHEPEQNAYGDWAAISIGGQYYLFCDYDPADGHQMSAGRFTASSINGPFVWCGHVGKGHPDPDVMFAEGKFYLATQQDSDFVSPGPWVETVAVRVGVDTNQDGSVNQWTA